MSFYMKNNTLSKIIIITNIIYLTNNVSFSYSNRHNISHIIFKIMKTQSIV